jgi:hypothetical protein
MENRNFFLLKNNFISIENCNFIINLFKDKTEKKISNGINYYHFLKEDLNKISFMHKEILKLFDKYRSIYPEIDIVSGVKILTEFKFKHFKPGNYFNHWHSEHSWKDLKRIAGFTIYLSEHNCGTEFFDGTYIKSEMGKAVIFPCSFTHTHRGQPCPEKKDRYLLTGYLHTVENEFTYS